MGCTCLSQISKHERFVNITSIWEKKIWWWKIFQSSCKKTKIICHLHASTGCTTKNKIITKKSLCKISRDVCHYTGYKPCNIYIFISHFSNDIKKRTHDKASILSWKFLALWFRVVWRIPLASISRGYKWIAWPIPLFNSSNYKTFSYSLHLIQHQYSKLLYMYKDSALMTIINYVHHEERCIYWLKFFETV